MRRIRRLSPQTPRGGKRLSMTSHAAAPSTAGRSCAVLFRGPVAAHGGGVAVVLFVAIEAVVCGSDGDDGAGSAGVALRVEGLVFFLVEVLAWVGGFVFEHLDEFVEAGGEESAEDGAHPVDLGGSAYDCLGKLCLGLKCVLCLRVGMGVNVTHPMVARK